MYHKFYPTGVRAQSTGSDGRNRSPAYFVPKSQQGCDRPTQSGSDAGFAQRL